jgi:hypothetical protein
MCRHMHNVVLPRPDLLRIAFCVCICIAPASHFDRLASHYSSCHFPIMKKRRTNLLLCTSLHLHLTSDTVSSQITTHTKHTRNPSAHFSGPLHRFTLRFTPDPNLCNLHIDVRHRHKHNPTGTAAAIVDSSLQERGPTAAEVRRAGKSPAVRSVTSWRVSGNTGAAKGDGCFVCVSCFGVSDGVVCETVDVVERCWR